MHDKRNFMSSFVAKMIYPPAKIEERPYEHHEPNPERPETCQLQ